MKLKLLLSFILFNSLVVGQNIMTNLSDWTAGGNVTTLAVNAGVLEITPNGGNFPTINYPISVDGMTYKYVRVLVRNSSSYDQIRFRDATPTAIATPTSSILFGQSVADGFTNYYIDLTAFAAWSDPSETQGQIRFSSTTTGNTSLIEIKEIEFFGDSAVTVWNGSTWSNGTPDATKTAIIASGTLNLTANTNMYRAVVYNGSNLIVTSGNTLTLEKELSCIGTGSAAFRVNSSLLQNDVNVVNTAITYRRNSTMKQFDYTYWSSPVKNQVLNLFSPLTLGDKFFSFNADPVVNNWVLENQNNVMDSGYGYAIRAPQGYTTTPQTFSGDFIGVPNNGDVTVNVYATTVGNYNLLGNPYPSAIRVSNLIAGSSITTVYYWTHITAVTSNLYTANDYAVRTSVAGTAAISGGSAPSNNMAAGQGFFATSTATGPVTFTNAMRVLGSNAGFFRNENDVNAEEDDNLLRLDVTNTDGAFKQQVILYLSSATNGYDSGMDGDQLDGQFVSFYSIIPGHNLAIQAKALPWEVTDVVPLGFKSTIAAITSFDITISELGIFFDDKDVFLEDKVTNTFHNLKVSPYTFTSDAGIFNNRFVIHYQDISLSNDDFAGIENSVYVFKENNQPKVVSTKSNIASVMVYDTLGRIVFSKDKVNASEVVLSDLIANNQALIIKTTLENNVTVAKKFIF
ncbi:T9SS sorting signal type C domain-containing protein [Flavobacterium sp. LMO8]|uniref:T9SS sorting signal type C domain-containing protein n=1 Tax=Flavobacterium sp. LMO8 TaxID=2654244 RepID=UPI001292A2B9|nr:T9SS sorting signal type C domain-containing protein [Flavobacterium sp. LMO8]MQP25147.1 T9SS sorting signal type C domain-containing protein [Flavobacterium sp. LMO8]